MNRRSSVSRYERFAFINGFAVFELAPAKPLASNLFEAFQPAPLPGFQLGNDSLSWLATPLSLSLPRVRSAFSASVNGRLSSLPFSTIFNVPSLLSTAISLRPSQLGRA